MASLRHNELSWILPTGWEDGSQLIVVGPVEAGFQQNIVIMRERAAGENSERFAARQLAQLKKHLSGFAVLSEAATKLGRYSGILREHSFVVQGNKLHQLQFYMVLGQIGFTITYTHVPAKWSAARQTLERLLQGLQLPSAPD